MKMFNISDVISVTTGRLVSSRHMDGIYELLNFLTGDNLYTHQLPRARRECEDWLRTQFPYLMPEHPVMKEQLEHLKTLTTLDGRDSEALSRTCAAWVEATLHKVKFPESVPQMLPVYEMGSDMHTRIDPVEELAVLFGDENVIAVEI